MDGGELHYCCGIYGEFTLIDMRTYGGERELTACNVSHQLSDGMNTAIR